MSVPTERPVALAAVTVLNTALGASRAGYGDRPNGAGWQAESPNVNTAFTGYAVVWPGMTLLEGGTMAAPNADAVQTVQVTYVGKTAEQADALRDRGRTALLTTGAIVIPNRTVGLVELSDSMVVRRDDDVTPPLYMSVDRYDIHTTP